MTYGIAGIGIRINVIIILFLCLRTIESCFKNMEVVCISIYAISDIHGYYNEFRQLLDRLGHLKPFEEGTDTLILLGDYIDGGPKSYEVLELVPL